MKSFNKFLSLFLCLIIIICGSLVPAFAEEAKAEEQSELVTSFLNPNGRVLSVANLGNTRTYPENSLEGIKSCISLGVDAVAVKVQLTKDNQLVLLSNSDLSINCATKDKGTAVMGNVSDYTVEDLQAKFVLRAGHGNGTAATKCSIATLKDAITATSGKLIIIVLNGASYTKEINTLVRETGASDYIIIGGFKTSSLVESTSATMANYNKEEDGSLSDAISVSINAGASVLCADVTKTNALNSADGKIRMLINMSEEDLCGGLSDRTAGWAKAIELGYSMIITDYPSDLVFYLTRVETIRTNLSTLIGTAASMDTSMYTKVSRKALEKALDNAKEISGQGSLSLDEADEACYELQEAIDGLTISTGDEKIMLPVWLVIVIVIAAIIVTLALVVLALRIFNKAKRSKKKLDKFKEQFSSDVPVENDESITTNIQEDEESNMGILPEGEAEESDAEEAETEETEAVENETETEDSEVETYETEPNEVEAEVEEVPEEMPKQEEKILVDIDYSEKETEETEEDKE